MHVIDGIGRIVALETQALWLDSFNSILQSTYKCHWSQDILVGEGTEWS